MANYFTDIVGGTREAFQRGYENVENIRRDVGQQQAARALARGDTRAAKQAYGRAGMAEQVDVLGQREAAQAEAMRKRQEDMAEAERKRTIEDQDRAARQTEAQYKNAAAQFTALGGYSNALLEVPYEKRKEVWQTILRPAVVSMGMPQEALTQLDAADLSDDNLRLFARAMGDEKEKLKPQYNVSQGAVTIFNPNTGEVTYQRAPGAPTPGMNAGVPEYKNVQAGINPVTGQRQMFGFNTSTGQFEPLEGMAPPSGTSAEFNAKAQSMLPQAFTGLATIANLFKDGKNPLNAINEQAAEYAQNIPFVGPQIAKTAGGKDWQAFNQAWAAIKQTVHIPAGAAVSAQEFQSFIDANKPALGDNDKTVEAKLRNTALFLNGLSAAASGDPNGVRRFEQMYEQAKRQSLQLLNPSQSQLTPAEQDEARALQEEIRRLKGG